MQVGISPALFDFAPVGSRQVVAGFDGGAITSNAGALLLGATDRAIGLVRRFAACFGDARAPERIEHEVATLVGQRVFGIVLGHEDLVDHDQLRHDPVLAVLAGKLEARRAGCAPLAGKSTLNRLEHAPLGEPGRHHRIGHDGAAIEALLVKTFKRDYARVNPRPDAIAVLQQLPAWFEDYNAVHPHSGLRVVSQLGPKFSGSTCCVGIHTSSPW